MSISAKIKTVYINENGSGQLGLVKCCDDPVGQSELYFKSAPEEVTALNGLDIWGDARSIYLRNYKIASRIGYTEIVFVPRYQFVAALDKKGQ